MARSPFPTILVSVLLWLAVAAPCLAVGQVGERAADFTLPNTRGEQVEMVFASGQVTLLAFVGWG